MTTQVSIRSPYDYPQFQTPTPFTGEGKFRTVLMATVAKTRNAVDGNIGIGVGDWQGSEECGGKWSDFSLALPDVPEGLAYDGLRIRGAAEVARVRVVNIQGGKQHEGFGVHVINRDNHGVVHGGGLIYDVDLAVCRRDQFVTALCVHQIEHDGIPLFDWSISNVQATSPGGAWSGFTATRRTRLRGCRAYRFANWFNCDSGEMTDVKVDDIRGEIERAAVRLAIEGGSAGDPQSKGGLEVNGGKVVFVGPGPFFAIEAFRGLNAVGQYGAFRIRNVEFVVPDGAEFYPLSTQAELFESVDFDGCRMPKWAKLNLPSYQKSVDARGRLRFNGRRLDEVFADPMK